MVSYLTLHAPKQHGQGVRTRVSGLIRTLPYSLSKSIILVCYCSPFCSRSRVLSGRSSVMSFSILNWSFSTISSVIVSISDRLVYPLGANGDYSVVPDNSSFVTNLQQRRDSSFITVHRQAILLLVVESGHENWEKSWNPGQNFSLMLGVSWIPRQCLSWIPRQYCCYNDTFAAAL